MTLYDTCLKVGHAAGGVSLHGGLGVLYHHHAVLVVGIGNGKSALRQAVEKCFLGVTVVLKRLVIIQMVTCEVREKTAGKGQSADAFLRDGRSEEHTSELQSRQYLVCRLL